MAFRQVRFYSPVGFAVVVLLGLELVTGSFAIIPAACIANQAILSKAQAIS